MSNNSNAANPDGAGATAGTRPLPSAAEAGALLDQLPVAVYISDAGVDGRWHYISSGLKEMLGFSPEEWIADPTLWARQVHPEDRERVFGREDDLLEPSIPDDYRLLHRDGAIVWVRDEAALVPDREGNLCWHGVISDITDRKLAEAELERRSEQTAIVARIGKQALEGADVAQLMREALSEATRILGVSSGAVLQLAGEDEQLVPRAALGLGLLAGPREALYRLGELPAGLEAMIEGRGVRWGVLWLAGEGRSWPDADADFVQALANTLADALRQRATEDDIRHRALHDPLTGLPNRVLFLDRLEQALSRRGSALAVVLLDIDHFKLVNDSLGHGAGDELLMKVAPRLRQALRPGDTIGRLGGDEFVVLVEGVSDERDAAVIAERIVGAFGEPFELSSGEHFASASCGVAIAAPPAGSPASLIRDADAAMYQAKERGRARFEIFDRAMRARTVARLSLENDLRRAAEREELRLAYQPIVGVEERRIVAVEALLRWAHPTRGMVAPAEFIGVAEESGLIEPIGRWVLATACRQAAEWQAARPGEPPLGISVNLSARQFAQRDLEAMVLEVLVDSGVVPTSLRLELTESVLLREPEQVSQTIGRLVSHGVGFLLDDFGTGYSSLAYLSGLPIDGLKIDRSFVDTLGNDPRSAAITTAIVRLAQALSLDVIAEGVENDWQLNALRELGCELVQGFHLHRPLPAEEVSRLLGVGEARRPVSGAGAARPAARLMP